MKRFDLIKTRNESYPGVAQLIAHVIWDHGAASLSLATRTINYYKKDCKKSLKLIDIVLLSQVVFFIFS